MELEITTLIENQCADKGKLLFEHGLSLYIEADGKKILFDTGQSGGFLENAKVLGKDLNTLDYCILSHGHYDHTGGLERLVSEAVNLPKFIVGEEIFNPKYKAIGTKEYKYNGNSFSELFLDNLSTKMIKVSEDIVSLTEHIFVFHHFRKRYDFEQRNPKFFVKTGEEYIPDDFTDEVALGIHTKKGLVVVAGCSHVGIVNILKTISERTNMPIYAVVGGTHLVDADEERIRKTIEVFQEMKIQMVAVSHCTGKEGIHRIKESIQEQFVNNNTGHVIQI